MPVDARHMKIARIVVYVAVSVASVVVLGLSAHWLSVTETKFGIPFYDPFAALAAAAAAISLVTLPIMIIVDVVSEKAFTSTTMFQLAWLGTLAVLWLVTAIYTTQIYVSRLLVCWINFDIVITGCKETQAIQAFSYLSFFFLFLYLVGHVVNTVKSHGKDKRRRRSPVDETESTTRTPSSTPPAKDVEDSSAQEPLEEPYRPYQQYPLRSMRDVSPRRQAASRKTRFHA